MPEPTQDGHKRVFSQSPITDEDSNSSKRPCHSNQLSIDDMSMSEDENDYDYYDDDYDDDLIRPLKIRQVQLDSNQSISTAKPPSLSRSDSRSAINQPFNAEHRNGRSVVTPSLTAENVINEEYPNRSQIDNSNSSIHRVVNQASNSQDASRPSDVSPVSSAETTEDAFLQIKKRMERRVYNLSDFLMLTGYMRIQGNSPISDSATSLFESDVLAVCKVVYHNISARLSPAHDERHLLVQLLTHSEMAGKLVRSHPVAPLIIMESLTHPSLLAVTIANCEMRAELDNCLPMYHIRDLLDTMYEYVDDKDVVEYTLSVISSWTNEAAIVQLMSWRSFSTMCRPSDGTIHLTLQAMKKNLRSTAIQTHGARLLSNIAKSRFRLRKAIVDAGGIRHVVDNMKTYLMCKDLQLVSCEMLCSFTAFNSEVLAAGGAKVIRATRALHCKAMAGRFDALDVFTGDCSAPSAATVNTAADRGLSDLISAMNNFVRSGWFYILCCL